jgi:hypothetical protein
MRAQQKAHTSDIDLRARPSNVVPFPGTRRQVPTAIPESRPARQAAITVAQLNARLLLLLGVCTMSATSALLAVRLLHG